MEKERINDIAEYMYNEIDDCDDCPLEKICDRHCKDMWFEFLKSKDMVVSRCFSIWRRKTSMTGTEAYLIDYIIRHSYSCPIKDAAEDIDFEKECVGFKEKGCEYCIYKHAHELN